METPKGVPISLISKTGEFTFNYNKSEIEISFLIVIKEKRETPKGVFLFSFIKTA